MTYPGRTGEVREQHSAWSGEVTWREVPGLRESLFDHLEVPGSVGVRLDVRRVTAIDGPGIALLLGANYRATATGRRLILVDASGPVTAELTRRRLIRDFLLTELSTADPSSWTTDARRRGGVGVEVRPSPAP